MSQSPFKRGDRVYWEITDASGQKIQGVGRIDVDVSFQWLEDTANAMTRPVWIGIKKIKKGQEVFELTSMAQEMSLNRGTVVNN